MCQGRALNIVRLCITPAGEYHGLEAWHRLLQEYEPTIATRAVSQLAAILTPSWSEDSFLDQWRQWEYRVAQYKADQNMGEFLNYFI